MVPAFAHHRPARIALTVATLLGLLLGTFAVVTSSAVATPTTSAVAAGTFRNPLNTGPDPFMTHWNSNYYLATTQGDSIRMWRSPSVL